MKSLWLAMSMVIVLGSSCKKDKKEHILSVDKTEVNISGLINGQASLKITSSTNWTIKAAGSADWLQIEPSSGTGDATVQLKNKVTNNSGPAEITLTLSGEGNAPVNIKVTRIPLFHQPILNVLGGSNSEEFNNGAATPDGGYILIGNTYSTDHDFSERPGSERDAIAVKYTATGSLEWKKTYGGNNNDYFYSVIVTQDGGFLLAGSSESDFPDRRGSYDFWITKMDKNGIVQWTRMYGSEENDQAFACVAVNDGYIIAGSVTGAEGDVTDHFGSTDAWIIKLDLTGKLLWQKSHGGSDHESVRSLLRTSDGNFVLAGNYGSSNGSGAEDPHGSQDAWLMKFDANNGNKIWSKRYGGSGIDVLYNVYPVENGELVAVGTSASNDGQLAGKNQGGEDGLVLRVAADGQLQNISLYGGAENDRIQAAVHNREQGLVVAGFTLNDKYGPNKGKADAMLLWINNDGTVVNSKLIGSSGNDLGLLLFKTTNGRYVTGGYFSGEDGDFSTRRGAEDCWSISFQ
ncbi:BACON domain-containing protein [Pseudobacter ginsenosidimutans]|uniref:BACON domain-containing protein n=1 Tax=Pseudobacter ginsenosidimutans TaxID=661488 RepID=A0A4Q7MC99_9BACT|nr:BACON domain-containing protein [Pseudobacter ginsenosidimutans]QEC42582.1 BACON domain-containing protein [Pseudobacter ginsenosidimutans]RZS63929.1 hypothetical protein EV199_6029 [Pseudobacter ginsenosidimutans]